MASLAGKVSIRASSSISLTCFADADLLGAEGLLLVDGPGFFFSSMTVSLPHC
jgi:hypothetical protein